MNYFTLTILFLALLILLSWSFLYFLDNLKSHRPDRAVFIWSNTRFVAPFVDKIINKYIKNTKDYHWYEPGAGFALMTEAIAKRHNFKTMKASEVAPSIQIPGRIYRKFKNSSYEYYLVDLFDCNYPAPAVFYCYLFPRLLAKMYEKGIFKKSLVISLTFEIPDVRPTEIIVIDSWQKQINIYDFR